MKQLSMINGKKIADAMIESLKDEARVLNEKNGRPVRLAMILVGDDAGSKKFLELKQKAARSVGIDSRIYEFPADISSRKLRAQLAVIAKARVNTGMLIELPLPAHLNTQYILNSIPEAKDVDMLSQKAQGAFFTNRSRVVPPAVEATKQILLGIMNYELRIKGDEEDDINLKEWLKGKQVVIFGYGLLVGKPIAHWFLQQLATVTVVQEWTENPKMFSKDADIVVSGVGKANLITADMIKQDAIVIDFGFNTLDGGVVGDIDYATVSQKTPSITPVPGGVGPVVVASVLKNLVMLASPEPFH